MIEDIKSFIIHKSGSTEYAEGLVYACQAGSFISGTNDETSDLDYRGIVLLGPDHYIGLSKFDHGKFLSGQGRINLSNDFDIELFSPLNFIKEAYHGEIIPFEMLHIEDRFKLLIDNEVMKPLFENRDIFLSKAVVKRYIGFIKGCMRKALVPVGNLNRVDKIERATKYGYETKDAMNSIKCSRLMLELLDGGVPKLYRSDREELLDIKCGKYTKTEYVGIIEDLLQELEEKMASSVHLPKVADFVYVNEFTKKYMNFIYEYGKILG